MRYQNFDWVWAVDGHVDRIGDLFLHGVRLRHVYRDLDENLDREGLLHGVRLRYGDLDGVGHVLLHGIGHRLLDRVRDGHVLHHCQRLDVLVSARV